MARATRVALIAEVGRPICTAATAMYCCSSARENISIWSLVTRPTFEALKVETAGAAARALVFMGLNMG
jgi:hypothetical protein